ncbi:MAG: polysaccharide biosynthesis tyrosine autokinase [Gammaproteobacteria bacterium]|nr:polysaccharide biosynthesis tyrosine autokinase [Gammaproteobacteria bacterium]
MNFQSLITKDTNNVVSSSHEMQLTDLVGTIADSWRLVSAIVLLMFFTGVLYILFAQPIYRADVLLQVEAKSKGISGLAELSELLQEESPVTAEFEILRSRMVLGAVVNNLKLDLIARAKHFPFVSLFIDPSSERIKVENFEVPVVYQGKSFELVAGENNNYILFDPDDKLLVHGEVGKPVNISLADGKDIKLFVSDFSSKPGTRFELIKKARLTAINQLKLSLNIAEQGKLSGILLMTLEGPNRGQITSILNEIANIYLRQSVERKSAEAEKTLLFLEKQLPILKVKMENAEAALNSYRLQKGSVDLSMETRSTLEKVVSIDSQLTQLRSDREELIRQFTPEHPRIASIDAQILNLNSELHKVDTKVKGLPGTQQEILRLTRDMEVSSSLYTSLMNSAQELKVVKAGAVGNVRIVDYAVVPGEPVKPKKGLVLVLMLVLGGLLGVGIALISKSLRGAVEDPDLIEKKLGLPVYATIPYSRKQRKLNHAQKHSKDGQHRGINHDVLAAADADDLAVESLRSLRTSLYFANINEKNNMLLITSPGPAAGKSFLCMNLATVLADSGKRVLVIDGDLRKGRIHQLLGLQRRPGLSDLIIGDVDLTNVVYKTDRNNLFVLTAGTLAPNPSELLMQDGLKNLLDNLSVSFDHIIIDSPPIMAVTDAAIIGRYTGTTLLVVRDAQSPLREIEQCVKRLKQAGVKIRGVVFNGMKTTSSRYGYYGYTYTNKNKA